MKKLIQLYKDSYTGFSKEIWFLALATLINRSGTMVMLYMSIYLKNELKFDLIQIGAVMTSFGIGSLLGSFLGGWLSDKIGYYKVLWSSLILAGIGFVFLIFVQDFYLICLIVVLTTLFGDMFRPASYVAVKAYSKAENQTRAIAIVRLAVNLGFTLGPAIGGILATIYGFHWVFILDGITCILSSFAILTFLPEKAIVSSDTNTDKKGRLMDIFNNKTYLGFLVFSFLVSIAFFQLFTILPLYLNDVFEYSKKNIGYLMGLNGLLIIIIEMPMVYLFEKKYSELQLITVGVLFMFLSYLLLGFNFIFIVVPILFMVLITIGEMLDFPFSTPWALNQSNESNVGVYMSAYTMTFAASHIVAPALGFYILNLCGYQSLWIFLAGLCYISFTGFYVLSKKEKNTFS